MIALHPGAFLRFGPCRRSLLALVLALSPFLCHAAPQSYPLLGNLGPEDAIYRQQQEQLEASYSAIVTGTEGPVLVL